MRFVRLAAVVGLAARTARQVASTLILSKHALALPPALPGASWARHVHMPCSQWQLLFAFAHTALQLKGMPAQMSGLKGAPAAALRRMRALRAAIAALGVVSFAQLGIAD